MSKMYITFICDRCMKLKYKGFTAYKKGFTLKVIKSINNFSPLVIKKVIILSIRVECNVMFQMEI